MHFLSHYFTELPEANPLFVSALIIPDLTKGFSRVYNSVIKRAPVPDDALLRHVHNGILSHYEADKRFHNSPLFMQHTTELTQSFLKEGLSRERLRLSVIAHIAIEMMIDRHIMLGNENICVEFYSTLGQVDERVLETYFHSFSLTAEKRSFLANFIVFKQREFLTLFKDLEKIVLGLSHVYSSVTKTEFTADEKNRFVAALYNIDNEMRYSWKEILKG